MQDVVWTTIAVLCFAAGIIYWSESRRFEIPDSMPIAVSEASILDEPIEPIPGSAEIDPAVRELGERLFHDPRLSGDGTQACSTCHDLADGGIDGEVLGRAIDGSALGINVPTVLNAGLSFRQFWDGRAVTLEEQIDGPLLSPVEMNSSWEGVIAALKADPKYIMAFREVYGAVPSPELVRHAIASFERSLLTPNARFDQYLLGDRDALSESELNGYLLFKDYGCIGCHQGVGVGGNMFQRLGIVRDYFQDRGNLTEADLGRFNVTGEESDRHVFKVPSLRNVALTPPYFHDGSAETLAQAIRIMGRYQLGREIPEAEVAQIEAFLHTLTGDSPSTS